MSYMQFGSTAFAVVVPTVTSAVQSAFHSYNSLYVQHNRKPFPPYRETDTTRTWLWWCWAGGHHVQLLCCVGFACTSLLGCWRAKTGLKYIRRGGQEVVSNTRLKTEPSPAANLTSGQATIRHAARPRTQGR